MRRSLFLNIFLRFWLMLVVVAGTLVTLNLLLAPSPVGPDRPRVVFTKAMVMYEFITFLAGTVFCYLITRHITRPVSRLRTAAAGISDGRLETRVDADVVRRRDEFGNLGRDFNQMAERLEQLVAGQRRLLGDASHELRSPLSRLIVALGLAKRRPDEATEHLARIEKESKRLDGLIGQLLLLSRMTTGAGGMVRERLDLTTLVQEIVGDADFEARAQGKRVVVADASRAELQGFEEVLRSAIENVVRNAVRHTPRGTAVEIQVMETPIGDGRELLVRVRDHGPGVPPPMLSEIFLPFRRVGSPSDEPDEGTGLGLAIAERAVALHGGAIHAENAADGGLIVDIRLPLRDA